MINPRSRSLEWITEVAQKMGVRDKALMEKTIRAFSLLEALARSGCPFLFKGGSSLMVELVERISRTDVPKKHAKFYYEVSYPGNGGQDKILLDVLFEETHYSKVVSLPIQSPLLLTEEPLVMVNLPSHEDLLGDKLTAFAPHTTGIPFFKGEKKCTMEIIKQLFDVASLFDITENLSVTRSTFTKFAVIELEYRHLPTDNIQQVLDDIYHTALCISMRGVESPDKAAYLSKLLEYDINEVHHYDPDKLGDLAAQTIQQPLPTKLNKLKKTHPEAFFYWNAIQSIL